MAMGTLIVMCVVATLVSIAAAIPGIATSSPRYLPTSCFGNRDQGVLVASVNDALWQNGAACGERLSVRCTGPGQSSVARPCTGKSVIVKVVDHCTGCPFSVVLSSEAYAQIANPKAANINIDFTRA